MIFKIIKETNYNINTIDKLDKDFSFKVLLDLSNPISRKLEKKAILIAILSILAFSIIYFYIFAFNSIKPNTTLRVSEVAQVFFYLVIFLHFQLLFFSLI